MKLIIKGTPEQARFAAHACGLDIRVESERDCGYVVAVLTTPLDARIEAAVVKWFCEDKRPFLNGSLLWYKQA
ncbi:MAG: hypothetical protein MN733_39725 [Nitrososphaera sp.]|nr:hypothetical protein [Nitrososphaera sp.]